MPQPRSERNPRLLECSLPPPPTSLPLELSPCPPHCSPWSSELGTCCHLSPGCTSSACPHGMLLASPRFANSLRSGTKQFQVCSSFYFCPCPVPIPWLWFPLPSILRHGKVTPPIHSGTLPHQPWGLSPTLPTLLLRDLLLLTTPLLLL